jgi:ubiquinone/menaquinone biosynthesis C-methylase UbiE
MQLDKTSPANLNQDGSKDLKRGNEDVGLKVRTMYNQFPFPPDSRSGYYSGFVHWWKDTIAKFCQTDSSRIRFLDAGCGSGIMITDLAKGLPEIEFLGVDFADASLRKAEVYAREQGVKNVTFRKCDLMNSDLPDASFDIINVWGVLHHLSDTPTGLKNICRALKLGGLFRAGIYGRFGCHNRKVHQEIIQELYPNELDFPKRLEIARYLYGNKYLEVPFTQPPVDLDDDNWLVDEVLHVWEQHFTMEQVYSWLKQNNIEVLFWLGFDNKPIETDLEKLCGTALRDLYPNVSPEGKLKIIERILSPYWLSPVGRKSR